MASSKTKVITGRVRFSYANVWEPKSINGGMEKYSVCLIIPKSDKRTIDEIRAAIEAARQEGRAKLGDKGASLKLPLRDGDLDRPHDIAYRGCYFINANSKDRPTIVDRNVREILDPREVYSGCFGRASITFYAFNQNGNRGIACALGNIQKLEDGEHLGGRGRVEDEFSDADGDEFIY